MCGICTASQEVTVSNRVSQEATVSKSVSQKVTISNRVGQTDSNRVSKR